MTDADDADDSTPGLLALLEPDHAGGDLFIGNNPGDWPGGRVFGGLVAGQALRAATLTVRPDHVVHSLHGYFMRPGRTGTPINYRVARVRDGRSFTTRTVVADQGEEAIFTLTSSFHKAEDGHEYQLAMATDVPDPDSTPEPDLPFARMRSMSHMEMREVGPTEPSPDGTYRSTRRVWLRAVQELPEDPGVHASVMTFMSDMGVVMAARPPREGVPWEAMMGASLDHAVWFHRPPRADEWLLYDLHALSNHGARGMVRGVMHDRHGTLLASVAQEALIRPLPPGTTPHWLEGPELRPER